MERKHRRCQDCCCPSPNVHLGFASRTVRRMHLGRFPTSACRSSGESSPMHPRPIRATAKMRAEAQPTAHGIHGCMTPPGTRAARRGSGHLVPIHELGDSSDQSLAVIALEPLLFTPMSIPCTMHLTLRLPMANAPIADPFHHEVSRPLRGSRCGLFRLVCTRCSI